MGTLQVGGTTLGVKNTVTNKVDLSNVGDVTLTSSANIKEAINASGSAPIYACRAWVNFNGAFNDATGQSGTYACSGSTITITDTSHGLSVGDSIHAVFTRSAGDSTSITDDFFNVLTVPSADTFTIETVDATTDQSGTVAYDSNALTATAEGPIRGSGNVSSITDRGTGNFSVNFTTAMPDANYCISGAGGRDNTNGAERYVSIGYLTTTSFRCWTHVDASTHIDAEIICASVFR